MTDSEQPAVRLRCRRCGWLSGAAAADVEAHLAGEHPGERIDVELVVVCPGCGAEHPVSAAQIAPALTAFGKILFPTARVKGRKSKGR